MVPAKQDNTHMVPEQQDNTHMVPAQQDNTHMVPPQQDNTQMVSAQQVNTHMAGHTGIISRSWTARSACWESPPFGQEMLNSISWCEN